NRTQKQESEASMTRKEVILDYWGGGGGFIRGGLQTNIRLGTARGGTKPTPRGGHRSSSQICRGHKEPDRRAKAGMPRCSNQDPAGIARSCRATLVAHCQ